MLESCPSIVISQQYSSQHLNTSNIYVFCHVLTPTPHLLTSFLYDKHTDYDKGANACRYHYTIALQTTATATAAERNNIVA